MNTISYTNISAGDMCWMMSWCYTLLIAVIVGALLYAIVWTLYEKTLNEPIV